MFLYICASFILRNKSLLCTISYVGQKCNKPFVKRKVIHDSSSVGEKIYKCSVKSNLILITSYMGGKSLKCSMKRNMILGMSYMGGKIYKCFVKHNIILRRSHVGASDIYKRMNNSEKKYLSSNSSVILCQFLLTEGKKSIWKYKIYHSLENVRKYHVKNVRFNCLKVYYKYLKISTLQDIKYKFFLFSFFRKQHVKLNLKTMIVTKKCF